MIKETAMWKNYGSWLRIRFTNLGENYSKLIRHLHSRPFTYLIDKDSNRYEDGVNLRYRYFDSLNNLHIKTDNTTFNGIPCSVLEMLCAFAERIDDEYIGEPDEYHPEIMFWHFMKNLDILYMTDKCYDKEMVDTHLDIWLNREFSRRGYGSIFELPHGLRCDDQRTVEMALQMTAYISHVDVVKKFENRKG